MAKEPPASPNPSPDLPPKLPSEPSKVGGSLPETGSIPPTSDGLPSHTKDRLPLPLLSRRKLKPPRELPGKSSDKIEPHRVVETVTARPAKVRWAQSWWAQTLFRLVAYAVIVGLGYGAYHEFRQTQVVGVVLAPEYKLPTEIYLVRDFSDDLKALRQEYVVARNPYQDELKARSDSLTQIQSDLADLDERQRLLQQEVDSTKQEIDTVVAQGRADQDKIWSDNVKPMEDDYNQKLQDLENALNDRAKKLGLDYHYDTTIRSPEVWANAYRLALYSPPPSVKIADERQWAEALLKQWADFEKSQDDKRADLKVQAEKIRQSIPAKLASINDRKTQLEGRIAETQEEGKPIREELDVVTGQVEQAKKLLDALTVKYFSQLYDIPTHNILDKLSLAKDGTWNLRQLDQNLKFPPEGKYYLWITIKKGEDDYWALFPFTPARYKTLEILTTDKAFIRAHSILE